jgi:hypothetical protein
MKTVLSVLLLFLPLLSEEPDTHVKPVPYSYNAEFIFPYWKQMHKLNTDPLESASHRAWIDLYVNDLAKQPYEVNASSFPEGSIVLKPLFPDKERSSIARLVIMMKMQKGYDSDNGDWWYGVYDETGKEGWHTGKIKSCIKCHTHAKSTDYMFSDIVMDEIKLQKTVRTTIK